MWIYLNDRFVSEEEAKVSVFDYGFLYGDGLFETLRAYKGQIFALSQHLRRLSDSALRLHMSIPSPKQLALGLNETLQRNVLKEAILRLTITRGEHQFPLRPDLCKKRTVVITARPFVGLHPNLHQQGVSADIVSIPRSSATGKGASVKSLNFLNNILAKLEKKEEDLFERILLSAEGYLSEGTVSNLFFIDQGILKTPSPKTSILEGVTRSIVIDLAKKEGITVEEGCYLPQSLINAEEAFLTNTGIELLPLTRVNGHKIGSGIPGKTSQLLHQKLRNKIFEKIK